MEGQRRRGEGDVRDSLVGTHSKRDSSSDGNVLLYLLRCVSPALLFYGPL